MSRRAARIACRWLGHRREGQDGPRYFRHGRWRTGRQMRCTRCGTSDGGEVFREGIVEGLARWRPWRLRRLARLAGETVRHWHHDACGDCGRTSRRFGRAVGDHAACDEIPF